MSNKKTDSLSFNRMQMQMNGSIKEQKVHFSNNISLHHYYQTKNFHPKPNVHSNYPRMCNSIGAPYCHILVAKAWIGPRPEGCELDHKDGNIRNCAVSNLEYVTPEENRHRATQRRLKNSKV